MTDNTQERLARWLEDFWTIAWATSRGEDPDHWRGRIKENFHDDADEILALLQPEAEDDVFPIMAHWHLCQKCGAEVEPEAQPVAWSATGPYDERCPTCGKRRVDAPQRERDGEAMEKHLFDVYGKAFPDYAWTDAETAIDLMLAEILATRAERDRIWEATFGKE